MSRKVFTCFIVIFFFLNKAASYGQEFQVSRDTVKVSFQEGNTSPAMVQYLSEDKSYFVRSS